VALELGDLGWMQQANLITAGTLTLPDHPDDYGSAHASRSQDVDSLPWT
jgi:hypothetical protein